MKIGNYILMETLGVGSFGKVKRKWRIHLFYFIILLIYIYIIFNKIIKNKYKKDLLKSFKFKK